jgi:hypothetical protein
MNVLVGKFVARSKDRGYLFHAIGETKIALSKLRDAFNRRARCSVGFPEQFDIELLQFDSHQDVEKNVHEIRGGIELKINFVHCGSGCRHPVDLERKQIFDYYQLSTD